MTAIPAVSAKAEEQIYRAALGKCIFGCDLRLPALMILILTPNFIVRGSAWTTASPLAPNDQRPLSVMSAVAESERVRFAYPTLRKEREGWGTRRLVAGIEPKSACDYFCDGDFIS